MLNRFSTHTNHRFTQRAFALIVGSTFALAPLAAQTGGMPPAPAPAPSGGHPSADSAQALVNLITTINRDEIAAGRMALTKSSSADVRMFAQHIVDDHSSAMRELAAKAPSASVTIPEVVTNAPPTKGDSARAMKDGIAEVRDTTTGLRGGMNAAALHSANVAALAEMEKASGAAFDKVYLSSQVSSHKSVLAALDANQTQNATLQPLVIKFRDDVAKHLSEARRLLGPTNGSN